MLICPICLLVRSLLLPLSIEYLNKKKYMKISKCYMDTESCISYIYVCLLFKLILG